MEQETEEDGVTPKNQKRKSCRGNTDLHIFLESFEKHQNYMEELISEKIRLEKEVASQKMCSKNTELKSQLENLQGVLDSTHKSLHKICDVEDHNRSLKGEIENLKLNIEHLKMEIHQKIQEHKDEIDKLNKEKVLNEEELRNSMRSSFEKEKDVFKKEMERKDQDIENLKEKLVTLEKEAEAETHRISMEYENKLTKLRQKIPSTSANNSSNNQEIFRMKLQHMKNEYEREVRLLRERISELEESRSAPQPQGGNRMTFTSNNKKRRF